MWVRTYVALALCVAAPESDCTYHVPVKKSKGGAGHLQTLYQAADIADRESTTQLSTEGNDALALLEGSTFCLSYSLAQN